MLNQFPDFYQQQWNRIRAAKLGLSEFRTETDQPLWDELLEFFAGTESDMTIFFRMLSKVSGDSMEENEPMEILRDAFYDPEKIQDEQKNKLVQWLTHYLERLKEDGMDRNERIETMNRANPKYCLLYTSPSPRDS